MLPSVSLILEKSISTYRHHTGYFVRFALSIFALTLAMRIAQDTVFFASLFSSRALAFVVFTLTAIAIGIVSFWMYLGLLVASKNALENMPPQPFTMLMRQVSAFLPQAIIASVASGALVALGGLLFVVPGLIFVVWYAFVSHHVIFLGMNGISALEKSKSLVVGRFFAVAWRVFAPLVAFGLLATIIELIVLLPFTWPSVFNPPLTTGFMLTNAFVRSLLYAIISPLITIASVQVYFALVAEPAVAVPPENPSSPST